MINYHLTHKSEVCCGCGACEQICHYSAICIVRNDEGFLYPQIDEKKCINCGLCNKVCPIENQPQGVMPKAAYVLMNKNNEELMKSSSGGVFRLFADYVIKNGGCVAGCVLQDMQAVFRLTDKIHEIDDMQGSKYISSCPSNIYATIKEKLNNKQTVLFTGTPCQNAALINYLNGKPENLITIDFLCHGMPSQKLFDKYIEYLESKYHKQITNFKFRDKEYRGWGHVESFYAGSKKHKDIGSTSTFLYGYLKGYFNRYSCYRCPYKGKRNTDFTMCDYWGVKKHHTIPNTEKGVSAITINTTKAIDLFRSVADKAIYLPTELEWIAEENPSIIYNQNETIPQIRRTIYSEIYEKGWKRVSKKYLLCPNRYAKKLWYMLPNDIVKKARKIIGKE